jgi:hypothetical protein
VTIFYCLRFETSLLVASYDSQGYGGGIRPRPNTGQVWLPQFLFVTSISSTLSNEKEKVLLHSLHATAALIVRAVLLNFLRNKASFLLVPVAR